MPILFKRTTPKCFEVMQLEYLVPYLGIIDGKDTTNMEISNFLDASVKLLYFNYQFSTLPCGNVLFNIGKRMEHFITKLH